MNRRNVFVINALSLISFLLVIGILTGGNIFNLSFTGFTFAEFYDTEVMQTKNAIEGEKTTFIIPINNNLNTPIEDLFVEIIIKDKNQNTIETLETNQATIQPNTKTQIEVEWNNDVTPDTYVANIYIYSKSSSAVFAKTFEIKEATIILESIQINDIKVGEEAKLDFVIQNYVNEDIENAVVTLEIYDTNNNIIETIETQPITLNASTINKIQTTWDTEFFTEKSYEALVIIQGEEYTTQKEITIENEAESIRVLGTGFAVQYTPEQDTDTLTIVIIIAGLLLVANVGVWIYHKKKK